VFSHARLDDGTRALVDAAPIRDDSVVLDLGCGYGPIGLAAAAAAPRGRAVLVDSNARAIALAERNARRNAIPNALALLRADLDDLGEAEFDLVLANPPYYSDFRIARAFVAAGAARLKKKCELWLVAKAADEHKALLEEAGLVELRVIEADGYGLVSGKKA